MWDLPGPGLELMSPTLAGGFLTTAPPGKPNKREFCFMKLSFSLCVCARGCVRVCVYVCLFVCTMVNKTGIGLERVFFFKVLN